MGEGIPYCFLFCVWNRQNHQKNLPKKPPEPPKNIPKPEPSKHPFFFSTTFTKKIREHFLFGTIKKSGNISKTQWCLDHLNRNSLLLTFLVDHMKNMVKTPFQRIAYPKNHMSSQNTLEKPFIPQRFHNNGTNISKTHMVFRLPEIILLKLKWQTVPGNKVHGTV